VYKRQRGLGDVYKRQAVYTTILEQDHHHYKS
jgi:hypothetical protein